MLNFQILKILQSIRIFQYQKMIHNLLDPLIEKNAFRILFFFRFASPGSEFTFPYKSENYIGK